jgi:hypothetical protein
MMKLLYATAIIVLLVVPAQANFPLYSQPHDLTNTLFQSSGSGVDYDQYAWDDFTLDTTETILEIQWRGGYDPERAMWAGKLSDFSISIWGDFYDGPDIGAGPLILYDLDTGIGTAGETFVGDFGSSGFGPTPMYDYHLVLPNSFTAQAGKKYWISIQAFQGGVPNWGLAHSAAGNNRGYMSFINYAGGTNWRSTTYDSAFALLVKDPVCGDWGFLSGDINQDCRVDLVDFGLLAERWMAGNCASPLWCNGADLDQSKSVDLADLVQLATNWVQCTQPYDAACVKLK